MALNNSGYGGTTYAHNSWVFCLPPNNAASNTIFFVERGASCNSYPSIAQLGPGYNGVAANNGNWPCRVGWPLGDYDQPPTVLPTMTTCKSYSGNSYHSGGTLAGMGDGVVKFIGIGVQKPSWLIALNPADGFEVGDDF